MFTANSMNSLMEVLGLALPGNGTVLAVSDQRRELVRQAAKHLMDNVKSTYVQEILSLKKLLMMLLP